MPWPFPSRRGWPIVIGGCYRSGTTLLRRLLDAHSRIHCGPEVKFFKDVFGDYLRDELSHIRFFSTVRSLGLEEEEVVALFGRAFVASHELAARKHGKRRWADKTPENVLYLEHWHELLGGRFFFIHVVRHPLDVLASMVEAQFDKTVPADFAGKVEVYRSFVQSGLDHTAAHPTTSTVVRYEALVADPAATLTTVLAAIGERFEPEMLVAWTDPDRGHGIEDPKTAASAAIHTQSIGRGGAELSADEARLARERLGAIAEKLGYRLETPALLNVT